MEQGTYGARPRGRVYEARVQGMAWHVRSLEEHFKFEEFMRSVVEVRVARCCIRERGVGGSRERGGATVNAVSVVACVNAVSVAAVNAMPMAQP